MKNARSRSAHRRLPGLRQVLPFALGAGCLWLVARRCEGVALEQVWGGLAGLSPTAWALAVMATIASFWAIGRYDVVMHRHFGTSHSEGEAAMAGRAAIAVGQTVGFGLLTGALVRWKWFEPRMSLWDAARLTLAVTVLFLLCWGVVTLSALAFVPVLPGGALWTVAAVAGMLALAGLSLGQPLASRLRFRWPSLMALGRLVGLSAVDTAFAALAFWLLLPAGAQVGFEMVFAVYLLALGAALITGTPGGLGPFEVTLLALLPNVAEADVLAACLAFRIVYYALPALAAGAMLSWRHFNPLAPSERANAPGRRRACAALAAHPNAELQLARQASKSLLWSGRHETGWLTEQGDQTLIGLFDPLAAAPPRAQLACLAQAAARVDRMPFVYKCDARLAAAARKAGWQVALVSEDAILSPAQFDPADRRCRQLRRKLRKAEQAGLRTIRAKGVLPRAEMAHVARAWAADADGERGFSMNRFAEAPLEDQAVFLAHAGGVLVGFASFHVSRAGWALDLVRQLPDAPDGTMHALVATALEAARGAGLARVSLAAVPAQDADGRSVAARMQRLLSRRSGGAGLRQFKASFNPRWEPRYLAAPSRTALVLGGLDVLARVRPGPARHTDGPIGPARSPGADHGETLQGPHVKHENYEIA